MDAIYQYIYKRQWLFQILTFKLRSVTKFLFIDNLILFSNEGEVDDAWVNSNKYESHGGIAHTPNLRRHNTS